MGTCSNRRCKRNDEDRFHDSLEDIYDKSPRYKIKIVIGDLNAKIYTEPYYRITIRRDRIPLESNNIAKKFIEENNNLIEGGETTVPEPLLGETIDGIISLKKNNAPGKDKKVLLTGNISSDFSINMGRQAKKIDSIIFNGIPQYIAYTDDLVIVGRKQEDRINFKNISSGIMKSRLKINERKPKYMDMSSIHEYPRNSFKIGS
ncbi:hypothetical protein CWI38_0108p0030 [Hamiltosporidium tvaerminnensis]|uniref:Reverse transcriptase domain-containing protein n=1 Tax=Hamiltosporidium tvaerminnensis TaxID=1176355 RepID=A0A4Q9M3E8_9MICR|nr:hypothetical protein CWI38_0108p0030 [Hamiltosporidium tvaerminnensis]